jgi:hypothetical protein
MATRALKTSRRDRSHVPRHRRTTTSRTASRRRRESPRPPWLRAAARDGGCKRKGTRGVWCSSGEKGVDRPSSGLFEGRKRGKRTRTVERGEGAGEEGAKRERRQRRRQRRRRPGGRRERRGEQSVGGSGGTALSALAPDPPSPPRALKAHKNNKTPIGPGGYYTIDPPKRTRVRRRTRQNDHRHRHRPPLLKLASCAAACTHCTPQASRPQATSR